MAAAWDNWGYIPEEASVPCDRTFTFLLRTTKRNIFPVAVVVMADDMAEVDVGKELLFFGSHDLFVRR